MRQDRSAKNAEVLEDWEGLGVRFVEEAVLFPREILEFLPENGTF